LRQHDLEFGAACFGFGLSSTAVASRIGNNAAVSSAAPDKAPAR
jgi:hypothetical protein